MKKPVIAVDIDEVLFPFLSEFIKFHNDRYQTDVSIDDFLTYEFHDTFGFSREEVVQRIYAFHDVNDLHVEPLAEAQHAIAKLAQDYTLIVITARRPTYEESTKAWLDKYFPSMFTDVHLVGHPDTYEFYRTKAEVCQEISATALIDDSIKHVALCAEYGVQGVLFGDYAWSQVDSIPEGVVHCKDWAAVLEYFDARR